jgi:hypothetical protein
VASKKLERLRSRSAPKKSLEFDPRDIGFTLKVEAKTFREIDKMRAESVKATKLQRKFAFR